MSRSKKSRKKGTKKPASSKADRNQSPKTSGGWSWGLFAVIVACAALYVQVHSFQLLKWDDNKLISQNAWVQAESLGDVFRVWSPQPALQGKVLEYFPLRDTAYAVIHWIWGLNPRPYHLFNLLLYLLNILLVYRLSFHLLRSREGAWFASLLFGLHPIHVEAVVWASAVKEQLMALFVLLSCEAFLRFWKRPSVAWGLLTVLAGLAASLSKHVGVIAPLLWSLFVFFDPNTKSKSKGSWSVQRLWPIAAGLVASLGIGILSLQIGKTNLAIHSLTKSATTTFPSWVLQPVVQMENLGRLLFPWGLMPVYDPPAVKTLASASYLLAVAGCLLLLVGFVWAWKKNHRLPLFALGWFLVGMAPFVAVQVSTQLTADRYLFLPSFAFCLLVAMGLLWLESKKAWVGRVLTVGVGVTFVVLAVPYIAMWNSTGTFWSQFVQRAPLNKHALSGAASYQLEKGNFAKAIEYNTRYLKHYPMEPTRAADLGVAYMQSRQINKGKAVLQNALKKFPTHPQLLYATGFVFAMGGNPKQASVYFADAVKQQPGMHKAKIGLAQTYLQTRRVRQAYNLLNAMVNQPLPSSIRAQAMGLLQQIRKHTGWK
ncbi:MAG: tetratricopeptide repeat protein [Deltaproteobacteria bacterium]|nr:MAG: tetratricopeptide repeat protein [Deltaproteobacteria bacterium]